MKSRCLVLRVWGCGVWRSKACSFEHALRVQESNPAEGTKNMLSPDPVEFLDLNQIIWRVQVFER